MVSRRCASLSGTTHRVTWRAFGQTLFSLGLLAAAVTCVAKSPASPAARFQAQQSSAAGKAQLIQWAGPGIPLADAVQSLRAKGFECQPSRPPSAAVKSAFHCSLQTPAPPPVGRRVTTPVTPVSWTATLESTDGIRVEHLDASRQPPQLGD